MFLRQNWLQRKKLCVGWSSGTTSSSDSCSSRSLLSSLHPCCGHVLPFQTLQPWSHHAPPLQTLQPCSYHAPPLQTLQPCSSHVPPLQTLQPCSSHVPPLQTLQPWSRHAPPSQTLKPCSGHVPPLQTLQPWSRHVPPLQTQNQGFCSQLCAVPAQSISSIQLFATPWTVACQAPLSTGFLRQEYWSSLLFPSPGIFPTQGLN